MAAFVASVTEFCADDAIFAKLSIDFVAISEMLFAIFSWASTERGFSVIDGELLYVSVFGT